MPADHQQGLEMRGISMIDFSQPYGKEGVVLHARS